MVRALSSKRDIRLTYSSGSELKAHETSVALRAYIDQELEKNTDIAERLQQIEVPDDTIEVLANSRAQSPATCEDTNENTEKDELKLRVDERETTEGEKVNQITIPSGDHSRQLTFNEVLAASRAYLRVHNLDPDAVSCISTTRSHGWSILSGISSSQVTRIGVICLPLRAIEVERFLHLAYPNTIVDAPLPSSLRMTLQRQLDDVAARCDPDISARPLGKNMVRSSGAP